MWSRIDFRPDECRNGNEEEKESRNFTLRTGEGLQENSGGGEPPQGGEPLGKWVPFLALGEGGRFKKRPSRASGKKYWGGGEDP